MSQLPRPDPQPYEGVLHIHRPSPRAPTRDSPLLAEPEPLVLSFQASFGYRGVSYSVKYGDDMARPYVTVATRGCADMVDYFSVVKQLELLGKGYEDNLARTDTQDGIRGVIRFHDALSQSGIESFLGETRGLEKLRKEVKYFGNLYAFPEVRG